jgi:WD40 repeat protein/predicted Ser/Thr protein kinase
MTTTLICYWCGKQLHGNEHDCPNCHMLLLLRHADTTYRIQGVLGKGSFGCVYQADEYFQVEETPRPCAIKVIEERPYFSRDHIRREVQFLKQYASQFNFMPDIYRYWSASPKNFIVMQFIRGHTLNEEALPWPPARVLEFLHEVLGHLNKLHAAGIIHRDIKPNNIKYAPGRGYVLLDFGLASEGETTILPGLTPDYAPLEQFPDARPPHLHTGYRSDLYSLATTAYYLLTGEKPMRADYRHAGKRLAPPAHPEGVPQLLKHILAWMLQLDPNQRAPDAQSVLDLFSRSTLPRPPSWPEYQRLQPGPQPPDSEEAIAIFQPDGGRLFSMDWSPDGRYLAAGSALGVSIHDLDRQAKSFYALDVPVQRVAFLGANTLAALTPHDVQLLKFPAGLPDHGDWQTRHERSSGYCGDWMLYAAGPERLLLIDDAVQLLPIVSTQQRLTLPALVAPTAAVSANGQVLATASIDGITIWQLEEHHFVRKHDIPIASDKIEALALTADGSTLAIGLSAEVRLWDVADGRAIPESPSMPGHVIDLDITNDGTMLAVVLESEASRQIRLWSIAQHQLLHVLEDTTASTIRVAFAPDGALVASHSYEQITIWDVASGEQKCQFDDHMDNVTCVAYSADGKWLAAMGGCVRVWHIEGSDSQLLLKLPPHRSGQQGLAFSPDSDALAVACGSQISAWKLPIETPPLLASRGIAPVTPLMSIPEGIDHEHGVAFTDQDIVCVGQGAIEFRSAHDGRIIGQRPIPNVGAGDMATVMTTDGRKIASYGGRSVVIWHDDDRFDELPADDAINSVAISPNRGVIAISTEQSTAIWQLSDLTAPQWTIPQGATRIVFDTTGMRLALLSHGDIDVRDLSGDPLVPLRRFIGHTEEVRDVAFAPSGRYLASASQDGTVRLWELEEQFL